MNILQAVNEMKDFHVFLRDILTDKKRILILSMGGGNDYIGAYSIAKLISKYYPKVDLVIASSISIKGDYKPLIKLNEYLFTIDDFMPESDFEIENHSIRLIAQGIKNVSFDRGKYKYHGLIKILAEDARSEGLNL